MPERAHTPFLKEIEWLRINSQGWDHDPASGGFRNSHGELFHWYLYKPGPGRTLALWDGQDPAQEPVPAPDPSGNFFVPPEEWNKIKGGTLMGNRNWVSVDHPATQTADLFEIVSVQIDNVRHIAAVKIG